MIAKILFNEETRSITLVYCLHCKEGNTGTPLRPRTCHSCGGRGWVPNHPLEGKRIEP